MSEKVTMTPLPKTGYYEMTRGIENPKPDRRSKSWACLVTIPARRVYVRVTEDHDRRMRGVTHLTSFRVEIGVGYDTVTAVIDADGAVVTPLADYPTVGAIIEAWNAGVFVHDASISAALEVVKRERSVNLPEVIEQLVVRGYVDQRELDLVLDFVEAREDARAEAQERRGVQTHADKLRDQLRDVNPDS